MMHSCHSRDPGTLDRQLVSTIKSASPSVACRVAAVSGWGSTTAFRGETMRRTQRRQMRVLHVVSDTNRRGAQVFAHDLTKSMCDAGDETRIVALTRGWAGAQLDMPVLGSGVRAGSTLWRLRREMTSADIVVAHGSATLLACSLAGLRTRTSLVYRNISDPDYWLSTRSRRTRVRLLLSRADQIVSLWPGGADYLVHRLGLDPARITVIPNGVPVDRFTPPHGKQVRAARARFGLPETARVLLYVAALQPEKHPDTAVDALRNLPDATWLLMVGDGPLRSECELHAELVAPGRVIFTGQISDPQTAYQAADVIVLPSEGEGLPAVLIEAGLCQVPAVASTSGGNADIVRDGLTGRVVPPSDPSALAAACYDVLSRRNELGAAAREHCRERYDMERVTEAWREILGSVQGTTELRVSP